MGKVTKPVMVIGGGIAGIRATLDLAEQGIPVCLVEKDPSIGGRMAQLDKTFPTLDCSMCILSPLMSNIQSHRNIELLTNAEVKEISGYAGDFKVKILVRPRFVDIDKCVGCGICVSKCPWPKQGIPDEYNMGLGKRKSIYIPFPQAVPLKAIIDPEHCLYFTKRVCKVCERVCPAQAIDFMQRPEERKVTVASIIIATGFQLDDPRKKIEYGYGRYDNVYTGLEFERLLSATGPTGGKIVRRSDHKVPKSVAFVQCVCSRDKWTNPYCSAYCCMSSVKQAILAKQHIPEVDCGVFYMDIRAFGKGFQEFCDRARDEFGIKFIKGRPARIEEDPHTKNLILTYEDVESSSAERAEVEIVVLSMGIRTNPINLPISLDEYGFVRIRDPYLNPTSTFVEGIFAIGTATSPKDIPDSIVEASAAAIRASIFSRK